MLKKKIVFLLFLVGLFGLFAGTVAAQVLPEPMRPVRLVNDFTSLFSVSEQAALERKLVTFADSTSTQIAVVTVADLDGAAISDYAQKLFDKWGIGGNSDKNNGILVLVKPKTIDSRGEVFIATGYGVEGAVPDALAGRIVDYEILPAFRQGQFYVGIDRATTALMSLTAGEFTADQYLAKKAQVPPGMVLAGIFIVIFIIISIVASIRSRRDGGSEQTISSAGDVMTAMMIGSLLGGRGHHGGGGFGGFSGGGGGFGGFGGGFSGGGGAGGSW